MARHHVAQPRQDTPRHNPLKRPVGEVARAARPTNHSLHQLQRRIGNRAVGRLLWSRLGISPSRDITSTGGSRCGCESCAHAEPGLPTVDSVTGDRGAATGRDQAGGAPVPAIARQHFESRFGRDFTNVRVHDDASADSRAKRMGAAAFAVGNDIYFASGRYDVSTRVGRWVLAHELAHVAQQGGSGTKAARSIDSDASAASDQSTAEREAHAAADFVTAGLRVPAIAPDGRGVRPQLLTEAQFRTALGTTPQQAAAINTLFANAEFLALWNYLKMCAAAPAQDLGPLALLVTPGLVIRGVVRFGGYNPATRTLEINPTKPEHVTNPAELVDTITHELIHAVDDLQADCIAAGSGPSPLAASGAGTVPPVAAGTPGFPAALVSPGPSASDPCGETIDENAAALDIVGRVVQSNITIAGVGHPTLTFVNLIIRNDPTAFAFYNTCRTAACALAAPAARTAAMASCSQQTIARFLPPAMTPALLPNHVFFDVDRSTVRPDARETLQLVALFVTSHPATAVSLIGHADTTGASSYNLGLGQRRADAVKSFLLGKGVPPAQIKSSASVGEIGASAVAAERWRDRSVEINP